MHFQTEDHCEEGVTVCEVQKSRRVCEWYENVRGKEKREHLEVDGIFH